MTEISKGNAQACVENASKELRVFHLLKGQVISGDFIISIGIFLLILSIVVPLFISMSEDSREKLFAEDLQTRLSFIAEALAKTSGVPGNWNGTSVISAGFSDAGRINKTKIRNFVSLSPSMAKSLLGVQELEMNVSFYSGNYPAVTGAASGRAAYFYVNRSGFFAAVNKSGLSWDLYYAGQGSAPGSSAVSTYTGAKAPLFEQMMDARNNYSTIIMEEPELTQADVDETKLQDFLNDGGVVIFEGAADLISSGFSMSSGTGGADGLVRDTDVIDADYNAAVDFASPNWYFQKNSGDAQLNMVVEHATIPGRAMSGFWSVGPGLLYYITDIEGSVNGQNLADIENFVGKRAELSTGTMQDAFVASRPVVYLSDVNSIGRMVVVLGK